MKCPADELWILFLEGAEDEVLCLTEHLEQCADCQQKVAQLKTMEQLLYSASPHSRNLCPSREELADFVDGVRTNKKLIGHIASCPECRNEVQDYEELTKGREIEQIWTTLKNGVAEIVALGSFQMAPPTTAKLRSRRQELTRKIIKKWRDTEVTISLSPLAKKNGVDLTIELRPGPDEEARIRMELLQQDRMVEARTFPMSGKLVLDGLSDGKYSIRLRDLVDGSLLTFDLVALLD